MLLAAGNRQSMGLPSRRNERALLQLFVLDAQKSCGLYLKEALQHRLALVPCRRCRLLRGSMAPLGLVSCAARKQVQPGG